MDDEIIQCVICGKDIPWKYDQNGKAYWTTGNNARPLADGRCCHDCDQTKVIPYRIALIMKER